MTTRSAGGGRYATTVSGLLSAALDPLQPSRRLRQFWWLETRPQAKVVVIAPAQRQIKRILWPEIAAAIEQPLMDAALRLNASKTLMAGNALPKPGEGAMGMCRMGLRRHGRRREAAMG